MWTTLEEFVDGIEMAAEPIFWHYEDQMNCVIGELRDLEELVTQEAAKSSDGRDLHFSAKLTGKVVTAAIDNGMRGMDLVYLVRTMDAVGELISTMGDTVLEREMRPPLRKLLIAATIWLSSLSQED